MKTQEPKLVLVPWWERGAEHPYAASLPGRPNAESPHPHWQPRRPGRKVLRQQARRRGQLRPIRIYRKGKGKPGPLGRIFQSRALPTIPQSTPTFLNRSGDR